MASHGMRIGALLVLTAAHLSCGLRWPAVSPASQAEVIEPRDMSNASDEEVLAFVREFNSPFDAKSKALRYTNAPDRLLRFFRDASRTGISDEDALCLLRWLGVYKETAVSALFIELLDKPMPADMSMTQAKILNACIMGLGGEGASQNSLEYLKRMTQEDYWRSRGAAPKCSKCETNRQTPEAFRRTYRSIAYHSFYFSGSQYALDSLRKGEGFPSDIYEPVELSAAISYCERFLQGWRPEPQMP